MLAWENFLKEQEKELGAETVDRWLRTLKVLRYDACNLYLEAKDAFQVIWFEEHIRKKATSSLVNNNNKRIKVNIQVPSKPQAPQVKNVENSNKNASQGSDFTITFDEPDPFCTFENFVPSDSNLLAYKLLCKITNYDPISGKIIPSEKELAAFNPIYLFGGEGSGKTHLLTATAHALTSRELRVMHIRAETFTEHVV
ncbi:MAG: DnaA ATPase domain-containing protein, partial [Waddliaceae bacterium]